MKKTEGHTENVYPKFLDNKPCGQDLFHGGAHTNIANKIAQIVQSLFRYKINPAAARARR